ACAYRAKMRSQCTSCRAAISTSSARKRKQRVNRCRSPSASASIPPLKLAPALSRRLRRSALTNSPLPAACASRRLN
ncbi:carboxylyase-like protein, partial [Pluralibacter gergoviae]